MSVTIDTIREKLHHYLEVVEDKKIQAIYTLFEEEIINIEQYNKDIEDAEKEIEAGNYYTHEQVLAEIKTWKKKAV
jgi:predicted transcriptional regulator